MVNYRVSQEVIPPTIGDVGFLGLGFLLFGCAEQVIVGEPQAVRSHDGHEHIAILVVHDVAGGIFTEWVADLAIFDAPVFPGYESPGANERIGCHCRSLLALWAARALVRIMMPAAEAGRELRRTPLRRSPQNPTRAQLRRGLQDSLQPSCPLIGETVGQSRITSQLAHEELVVLVDVLLEVVVDLRSRLGGVDYPSELQYAPIVVLFLYCFGQARVVLVGIHQAVFDDVCRNVLTSCLSRISPRSSHTQVTHGTIVLGGGPPMDVSRDPPRRDDGRLSYRRAGNGGGHGDQPRLGRQDRRELVYLRRPGYDATARGRLLMRRS